VGKSSQEDLFLTVDRFLQELEQGFGDKVRSALQILKIGIWKISAPIIHLLPPLFTPILLPSRMETPLPTPTMIPQTEQKIRQALLSASWAKRRNVVVNKGSNTISVFEPEEPDEPNLEEIPLSLHGVPIIPHPFPKIEPLTGPDPFESTAPHQDGLSAEELQTLRDFFPGVESIEFYFDRVIILRVARNVHDFCLEKVGGQRVFSGFGCVIWLLAVYVGQRHPIQAVEGAEEAPPASLYPGCHIYNSVGAFSTLGVFLVKGQEYPSSAVNIDYFTLSAHSYLKKREIHAGLNWESLILIPLCMYMAYVEASSQSVPISWCRQYFFNRIWTMLLDFALLTWALEGNVLPPSISSC